MTTEPRRHENRNKQISDKEPFLPGGGTLRRRAPTILLPGVVLVVALCAWQFLPGALGIKPFIIPKFSDVIANFTSIDTAQVLASNTWITVRECLIGLGIGAAGGILFGLLLGDFRLVRAALYPYVVAFQSLPKIAIAPLFVIWFGFGLTPKILVVTILAFFPVLVNTMAGVMSVDPGHRDLFRSLCAGRRRLWVKLLLPSALPSIMAGVEVGAVLSLLGAIVAEFVSAQSGLGVLLLTKKNNYDTDGVFAVLIILSAIGIVLNRSAVLARKYLVFWVGTEHDGTHRR